jgi:hypothetical protein
MVGGTFGLLKTGAFRAESAKQNEIRLSALSKNLSAQFRSWAACGLAPALTVPYR